MIISEQRASGRSIAAFCRRRRISEASFFAWRRKLRSGEAFAGVRIAAEPPANAVVLEPAPSRAIEIRLVDGRCLVIRPGLDRQTLLELLTTLEGADRRAAELVGVAAERVETDFGQRAAAKCSEAGAMIARVEAGR